MAGTVDAPAGTCGCGAPTACNHLSLHAPRLPCRNANCTQPGTRAITSAPPCNWPTINSSLVLLDGATLEELQVCVMCCARCPTAGRPERCPFAHCTACLVATHGG